MFLIVECPHGLVQTHFRVFLFVLSFESPLNGGAVSILKCHLGFVLKPRLGSSFFFHFEFNRDWQVACNVEL